MSRMAMILSKRKLIHWMIITIKDSNKDTTLEHFKCLDNIIFYWWKCLDGLANYLPTAKDNLWWDPL